MADKTGIEWTEATWNPMVGCSVASDGCTNCYAAREADGRLKHLDAYAGLTIRKNDVPTFTGEVRLLPDRLDQPLRWKRGRLIFVNSMSDLFHPQVPSDYIAAVFGVMAMAPHHTFQVLTKRPNRMEQLVRNPDFRHVVALEARGRAKPTAPWSRIPWPLPNVWLGTSVEDQPNADRRMPHLAAIDQGWTPWVSAEPLLADTTLAPWLDQIRWVVLGGESGPGARPMHPDWVRKIRDECTTAGVPFLLKQWGEHVPAVVYDAPDFSGGRAFDHPDGGTQAASIREASRKAFTSGITRSLEPGDRTRGGVVMLDENTVAIRVGKKAAGRELDGRHPRRLPGPGQRMIAARLPLEHDDHVGPAPTRVLVAVVEFHRTFGRVTIPDLCGYLGLSRATIHVHLWHLRRLGLVDWDDGQKATLHPLVAVLAPGP